MMSGVIGFLILTAATTLGAIEYAMGPTQKRFPCVNRYSLWILRLYTLALVGAAFDRIYHSVVGSPLPWTPWQVTASFLMAAAHTTLLVQVLRQRLPPGIWAYLQLRVDRTHRAASVGGKVGATLAREVADPDATLPAGLYQPPAGWKSTLLRLAGRP